jgi:hypothetical protein
VTKYSSNTTATLVSVNIGKTIEFVKDSIGSAQAELDGFEGDKHRSYMRGAYEGESYPAGTVRRNDRQWSAVSSEELSEISKKMNLQKPLTAQELGANLCFIGVPNLSQLPKGTKLLFPSGAALIVEEYNPPCHDMSEQISKTHITSSGETPGRLDFLKAAKKLRGLIGVIDVAGLIIEGDEVQIKIYDAERMKKYLAE